MQEFILLNREREREINVSVSYGKITPPVLHLFRVSVLLELHFAAAAETDRSRLSSAILDVLHEQQHSEHSRIGLQPAAMAESAQTQLQMVQFS